MVVACGTLESRTSYFVLANGNCRKKHPSSVYIFPIVKCYIGQNKKSLCFCPTPLPKDLEEVNKIADLVYVRMALPCIVSIVIYSMLSFPFEASSDLKVRQHRVGSSNSRRITQGASKTQTRTDLKSSPSTSSLLIMLPLLVASLRNNFLLVKEEEVVEEEDFDAIGSLLLHHMMLAQLLEVS